MAFHVPDKHLSLFDEVCERFRVLLKKRVITGIDEEVLDRWLDNFKTDAERYFAACVLGRLTFRSKSMIDSSIDQMLHSVLPTDLRRHGLFPHPDIETFLHYLQQYDATPSIRFVGIDGSRETDTGKSGPVMIRHYKRHAQINDSLTCRPDALSDLPEHVRCLIFIDDMLGTGKQFERFAKDNGLAEKQRIHMVYSPLIAFKSGLNHLQKKCPWLTVLPIEILDERHRFFCESAVHSGLWAVDDTNTVLDARTFFDTLAKKRDIPASTKHGLDLLLAFEDATPNNSLSVLWASSGKWTKLLTR